jgi:hypothetical protein
MRCSYCNQEHPEGAQFCPMTGKKIIIPDVCPECGKAVNPTWQYCGYCGQTMIQATETPNQLEVQAEVHSQLPKTTLEASKPGVGSKVPRLIISGGIGGLLIVAVVVIAVWIGNHKGDVVPSAVDAPASETTVTSKISSTLILQSTPTTEIVPTLTEEISPTSEIIPPALMGWKKFNGKGLELWLPESYNGGNLEDLNKMVEALNNLGPEYENIAAVIEQNPDTFAIWAFDSQIGNSGALTSANIVFKKVISAVTIDDYIDASLKQLPGIFVITDRQIVKLDKYDAGRLVIESSVSGILGKELMYVINNGNMFWVITYVTGSDEFNKRLPEFEKSALTFKVND